MCIYITIRLYSSTGSHKYRIKHDQTNYMVKFDDYEPNYKSTLIVINIIKR